MSEININYTTGDLKAHGDLTSTNVPLLAEIPFVDSFINTTYFSSKVYTEDNKNYGLIIKKDPIIVESNSQLMTDTPILYSFNNDIDKLIGKRSNYGFKFFIYPCLDVSKLVKDKYIDKNRAKNLTGVNNDYDFENIYDKFYGTLPYGDWTIPQPGLTKILGSGLECVSRRYNNYACYNNAAAYDINIYNLGINLPSNEERGINEETLDLFNKNNAIGYRDQRTIDKFDLSSNKYYDYYVRYHNLLMCLLQPSKIKILSRMQDCTTTTWNASSSNINEREKCIPYVFSNIITNNGDYGDALFNYSYSIILMGVKKVEVA